MKTRMILAAMLAGWFGGVVGTVLLGWTYTFDTATPLGSDAPSVIDDRIREVKAAVQERENLDHYWPLSGSEVSDANGGYHRKVTLISSIAKPSFIANAGFIYMKDFASTGELCWTDEDSNEVQFSSNGHIYIQDDATIDANSFNEADYATGSVPSRVILDGTILTADIHDGAILTADINDGTIAEADLSAAVTAKFSFTPATYTGGESVTFPNGLILKMGYAAGSNPTVTFGVAFPTAIVSITATVKDQTSTNNQGANIENVSLASFDMDNTESGTDGFYWMAIGY